MAVLPGSRADEIRYLGPTFLAAIAMLHAREPDVALRAARGRCCAEDDAAGNARAHSGLAACLTIIDGRSHDCLEAADAVLVASGTATLEAALYKRPMVIAYRMPALSAWLMRRKGSIPWVGLPNILAGESLVPELLQEQVTPAALADAIQSLLRDVRAAACWSSASPPCTAN